MCAETIPYKDLLSAIEEVHGMTFETDVLTGEEAHQRELDWLAKGDMKSFLAAFFLHLHMLADPVYNGSTGFDVSKEADHHGHIIGPFRTSIESVLEKSLAYRASERAAIRRDGIEQSRDDSHTLHPPVAAAQRIYRVVRSIHPGVEHSQLLGVKCLVWRERLRPPTFVKPSNFTMPLHLLMFPVLYWRRPLDPKLRCIDPSVKKWLVVGQSRMRHVSLAFLLSRVTIASGLMPQSTNHQPTSKQQTDSDDCIPWHPQSKNLDCCDDD
jgi:hypothetical protein